VIRRAYGNLPKVSAVNLRVEVGCDWAYYRAANFVDLAERSNPTGFFRKTRHGGDRSVAVSLTVEGVEASQASQLNAKGNWPIHAG